MVVNLMGQIAKFFAGRVTTPQTLLLAFNRYGKEAVQRYLKERSPSYNLFNQKIIDRNEMSKAVQSDLLKKKKGGMVKKSSKSSTKRLAGAAKRGFNNFKGIF